MSALNTKTKIVTNALGWLFYFAAYKIAGKRGVAIAVMANVLFGLGTVANIATDPEADKTFAELRRVLRLKFDR